MAKRLLPILIASTIIVANAIGPLFAQTPCGDYTDCVDQSNFDSTTDGWAASDRFPYNYTDVQWLETKSFGSLWWTSSADGVLSMRTSQTGSSAGAWKSFLLQPGTYRLVFSGAANRSWSLNKNVETNIYATTTLDSRGDLIGGFTFHDRFETHITDPFTVDAPRQIIILLEGGEDGTTWYFDYAWIVRDTTPTPTPGAGTPTATPIPPAATPIPTGTPYCINPTATPSPAPPEFALTPSPSPTPDPNLWSVLDKFDYHALADQSIWQVAGTGVHIVQNNGRPSAAPGAAYIPYSVDPIGWDYTDMDRTALIFVPETTLTGTVYVDGWVQADFVPSGELAQSEVWLLDGGTFLWGQALTTTASAQYWYNFHGSVSSAGGIVAIAFLSHRSDEPGSGGIYLDDVYMYGDLSRAPRCDGSYPGGTTMGSGLLPPSGGLPPTTINIPANRQCPPDLKVPNNFWGPLLAQLTLFLDATFAFAPGHTPGALVNMVSDLSSGPLGVYTTLASIFFDLRVSAAVAGLIFGLEAVRAIWSVWLIVKKSIPFL